MNKKIIYIAAGIIAIVVAGALTFKKATEVKQKPEGQTNNQADPTPVPMLPIADPVPSQSPTPNPTPSPQPNPSPTPNPTPSPTPSPTPTPTPQPPPPAPQSFSVSADDYSVNPGTVSVKKGAQVSLTFNVKTTNVYYGGLEFRSSVVNTGAIAPGGSKTVTFTAQETFEFAAYWPASSVDKGYRLLISVQ